MNDGKPVARVVSQMRRRLDDLPQPLARRRYFLGTYMRTTQAVGQAIDQARFEDPDWVEEWDVSFAEFYLRAHDADLAGDRVPRPWRLAFDASDDAPALLHVLLGINAHVNYDLPQALLTVIDDEDFTDRFLMDRRRRDHERIDGVLSERVSAEDVELAATGPRSLLDKVLTPFNRLASQRFLREARQKVWHNTVELQQARLQGCYETRLGELEVLSAAKVADLMRPGQVLLRLAVTGFGVTLPPPA